MTAIIHKKEKNVMQSGKYGTDIWVLEYKREKKQGNDSLMGWVQENDMKQEIKLQFPNKEDAISYAEREHIDYQIIEPKQRKIKLQSYADNFM